MRISHNGLHWIMLQRKLTIFCAALTKSVDNAITIVGTVLLISECPLLVRRILLSTPIKKATKVARLTAALCITIKQPTVPTIVIAHTFCASRDTRVSYR